MIEEFPVGFEAGAEQAMPHSDYVGDRQRVELTALFSICISQQRIAGTQDGILVELRRIGDALEALGRFR